MPFGNTLTCPNTIHNATGTYYFHCVYKYIPPQPLDIRYWWIGLAVMLVVMACILGFAMQKGIFIDTDTFIYLALLGLCLGGIIATLMDIMSWIMPFTIFIILILYVWRTRK